MTTAKVWIRKSGQKADAVGVDITADSIVQTLKEAYLGTKGPSRIATLPLKYYLEDHFVGSAVVGRGWHRDLTRECVEPNPGPTLEKVLQTLRQHLGKRAPDFDAGIVQLEKDIQAVHGDDLVMDTDVRTYATNHEQNFTDIFGEKKGVQIRNLLMNEVLPPIVFLNGWKRDLLRECVEPNPGPTAGDILDKLADKIRYQRTDPRLGRLYNAICVASREEVPDVEHVRGHINVQMIQQAFSEDGNPVSDDFAKRLHNYVFEILGDNIGWIRDLTRECVEANPGPTWSEFMREIEKKYGEDYSDTVKAFFTGLKNEVARTNPTALSVTTDHLETFLNNSSYDLQGQRSVIEEAIRAAKAVLNLPPTAALTQTLPTGHQAPSQWLGNKGLEEKPPPGSYLGFCAPKSNTLLHQRPDTTARMITKAIDKRVLLNRAPPAYGKTTLAYLLYSRVIAQKGHCCAVTCLDIYTGGKFTDIWNKTGKTFDDWLAQPDTCIIIDEVQLVYDYEPLWAALKKHQTNSSGAIVILFAMYGERILDNPDVLAVEEYLHTPLDIAGEAAPLLDTEFDGIMALYAKDERAKVVPFTANVIAFLKAASKTHVGVLGYVIEGIFDEFSKRALRRAPTQAEVGSYLASQALISKISDSRASPALDACDEIQLDVLDTVFLWRHEGYKTNVAAFPIPSLIHKGFIMTDEARTRINFPAPLLARSFFFKRSEAAVQYIVPEANSFTSCVLFATTCLRNVRVSQLVQTKTVDKKQQHPLEYLWQMEFYHVASSLARVKNLVLSPEMQVFNPQPNIANGRLDFYLDDNHRWGFELVAEGSKIDGHAERFTTGAYSTLNLKDYLVINFQMAAKGVPQQEPQHIMGVYYSANFEYADVVVGNASIKLQLGIPRTPSILKGQV